MPILTDAAITRAKPQDKTRRLFDSQGLYLEINPNGGRYWRFKYRFAKKEKRLSLGVYPKVSLKNARRERDAMHNLLDEGRDPGQGHPPAGKRPSPAAERSTRP